MNKLYMGIGLLIVLFLMFGPSTCNGVTYWHGIRGCSTGGPGMPGSSWSADGPPDIRFGLDGYKPHIYAPDHGSIFFDLINW